MKRLSWTLVAFVLAGGLVATACSDETRDDISDAVDTFESDATDAAQQTGARAAAEAWRGSLLANSTADTDPAGVRSVAVLEQSSGDLPGDPTIVGIEDTDGDGADDDGQVQVDVGDESACLTLPEDGDDIEVVGGACGP